MIICSLEILDLVEFICSTVRNPVFFDHILQLVINIDILLTRDLSILNMSIGFLLDQLRLSILKSYSNITSNLLATLSIMNFCLFLKFGIKIGGSDINI